MKTCFTLILFTLIAMLAFSGQAAEQSHKYWQANNSRLFTRPVEREKLDAMRQDASVLALQAKEVQTGQEAEEPSITLPAEISMQGYVKRNDGKKSTVWINHQALQENNLTQDVQVGTITAKSEQGSPALLLKLPSNGHTFKLKAGQSYLPDENRVIELKARGLNGKNAH
jgi:hypothetical protein